MSRRSKSAVALCLLAASLATALMLNILHPTLPPPSGPHPVGRMQVQSPPPDPVAAHVWYPARISTNNAQRHAHYPNSLASKLPWQRWMNIRGHALADAPAHAPDSPIPVLHYFPAYQGSPLENASLCEDLASHGFLVIAADFRKPDTTTRSNAANMPVPEHAIIDFSNAERIRVSERSVERLLNSRLESTARLGKWLQHELPRILPGLDRKVDFSRSGAFGYSLGGATSILAARNSPDFISGANLDGLLFTPAVRNGPGIPFLFMDQAMPPYLSPLPALSPSPDSEQEFVIQSEHAIQNTLATHGGWRVIIDGSSHSDFSDHPHYFPFQFDGGSRGIHPDTTNLILRKSLLAFFQATLIHGGPLHESIPTLPREARFQFHPGQ